MIEAIIALINSRLTTLGLFKDIKGLCEQIQKVEGEETLIFPAQYCEDQYTHIDDIANYEEGIAYHRQIEENTEETGEEAVVACGEEVTRAYPMRIVCLIPKNKLTQKNNDQYIDDKLATNIANTLKIVNNKIIAETLKADVVSVDIVSTQKDRYLVFEEEFTIPGGKVPGFEFAFFFIDYTISITATQSCFDNFDCDGFVVPQFCDEIRILDFEFGAADDNEMQRTIRANQAATYTSSTLTNIDTVVFEVGAGIVTLPFTTVNGGTLKVTITRTVPNTLSRVILAGTK